MRKHEQREPTQEGAPGRRRPKTRPGAERLTATGPGGGSPTAGLVSWQRTVGNAVTVQRLRRRGRKDEEPPAGLGGAPSASPATVHQVLRSPGRPLDTEVRADMEARLGADLSDVRLHTDPVAQRSAATIGARAYTSGDHVVIGADGADRHTLAHELTHVLQQRRGAVAGRETADGLRVSDPSDRFEREAESTAARVVGGPSAAVPRTPVTSLDARHTTPRSAPLSVQRFFDPAVNDDTQEAAERYVRDQAKTIIDQYRELLEAHYVPGRETVPDAIFFRLFGKGRNLSDEEKRAGRLLKHAYQGEPDAVREAATSAEVGIAVRLLNMMENENLTHRALNTKDFSDVKDLVQVGTEFTFTHSSLRYLTPNPDDPERKQVKNEAKKAQRAARQYMEKWADWVAKAEPVAGLTVRVTKGDGGKSGEARTFEYAAKDGWSWSWTLDLDEGCLETQTRKSTSRELTSETAARIIQQHIFAAASAIGLIVETGVTGGGGHVTLDSDTSFGGSAELFLETVRVLEDGFGDWKRYVEENRGASDTQNAPWVGDLSEKHLAELRATLDGIVEAAERGEVNLALAADRLRAHVATLPLAPGTAPTEQQRRHLTDPRNRPHYQAVNVEHMGQETKDGSRRLELRDLPAQRNVGDLEADLDMIANLLREAREKVSDAQMARLQERHNKDTKKGKKRV